MRVPVKLIRFHGFESGRLQFTNPDLADLVTLPLAQPYHELAARLEPHQLCKVSVLDGTVVLLEPTRRGVAISVGQRGAGVRVARRSRG